MAIFLKRGMASPLKSPTTHRNIHSHKIPTQTTNRVAVCGLWLVAAVCEVETMCFHNLSKPVAVHKSPESIFSPPFAHGPAQKACKSIAVSIPSPQSSVKSAKDTLILEDRQPQVCAWS